MYDHVSMRPLARIPFLLALSAGLAPIPRAQAEPVRLSAAAFGATAEVEVRGLPREAAQAAARKALREIFDLSQLLDPSSRLAGGVGELNAAAGQQQPLVPESRVADLLRRGLQYCLWSNGSHGPLGGELYRLWNGSGERVPEPSDLYDAVVSADCSRLVLSSGETGIGVRLAAGSRVETVGMRRGFAIDRAAEILKQAGVDNAWLEIGGVWRAVGPGPDGQGWLATLPPAPGSKEPVDRIWLQNQSLAIVSIEPVGDETAIRFIDQRTGVPSRGVVTVAAVTEFAIDAEALAVTMFIEGMRRGQMRLGALQPRPAVLWLLGEGKGTPLQSTYRWSQLVRVKRRNY